MTLMLQAPYPDIQTTSILPNPKASDFQNQTHSLDVHRSMNGVKYTYVKSKPDRRLTMNFTLSRMKALELREFIRSYYRSRILLTDHNNVRWSVVFADNPFDIEGTGRAFGWPGNEANSIQLRFEGYKL